MIDKDRCRREINISLSKQFVEIIILIVCIYSVSLGTYFTVNSQNLDFANRQPAGSIGDDMQPIGYDIDGTTYRISMVEKAKLPSCH